MTTNERSAWKKLGLAGLALAAGTLLGAGPAAGGDSRARTLPLKAARLIVEYNASAEDIGVQAFLDSEGWREVEIVDPLGVEIFEAEATGRLLRQGGGTELFIESVEPGLDELPVDVFLRRFPAGDYRFRGRSPEGDRLVATARFSHVIPEGPLVLEPTAPGGACATDVPLPVMIRWEPVDTAIDGSPAEVVRYQIIVENADAHVDLIAPASAGTEVTVPVEVLEPGTDYIFEVLAIEKGGNQTITEGCFRTAN